MKRFFTVLLVFFVAITARFGQFRKSREKAPQTITDSNLNYANPTEYYIAGIEVVGLNVLDKNAMISLTGLKIGDKIRIPSAATSTAVRKLWKHGLVGDVTIKADRIEGNNVYLTIQLTERPRLTDFYFRGLSQSKQSSLKEDMRLIRGKIVTDAMVRNAVSSVKKHFVKKGFLNKQVKIVREKDTLNRNWVRVRIAAED